jgi:hypothetical protein
MLTQGTTYWFAVLNPADSTGLLWWNDRASVTPAKERTSRDGDLTAFPANWFIAQRYDGGPLSAQLVGPDPATPIPSPPPPTPTPTATATLTAVPSETATGAPTVIPPAVPTPLRTPAPPTKPNLSLPSRLSQDRNGVVRLRLRCPDTRPCRFRAELRHGRRRLGRAAATVAPGAARTLHVRVTPRARHRQTVTVRVAWSGQVFSRSAVLSAPRRAS